MAARLTTLRIPRNILTDTKLESLDVVKACERRWTRVAVVAELTEAAVSWQRVGGRDWEERVVLAGACAAGLG